MYILRLEVKQHVSALYGHHQVFFFFLKVSLYKLRCGDLPSDYNSSMPIYRRVLYYINVYIFFLSLLVGGGFHPGDVSWMSTSSSSGGCCHEAVDGWPSGNGLMCMEASLCVCICCGPDS